MKMTPPLVSVYIPTHNRYHFLERALNSVMKQTYSNLEIIVVDDGSTDNTELLMLEFLKRFQNIRYLKHSTPKGANAARNLAIREAKGYYITGLDDDDEMLPECIEKLLNAYTEKYAYVFGGYNIITPVKSYVIYSPKEIITLNEMHYSNITGNQVFTTKETYTQAGLFDENLEAAQDYDLWIRMLKVKHSAKGILEPLYNVYESSHERISTSSKKFKGYFNCYIKYKKDMNTDQRKVRLAILHNTQGKKLTISKINLFFPIYRWPRLYIGFVKRKLFAYFTHDKKNKL